MYREHRREVLNWMLNAGKEPEAGVGYAEETVKNRAHRLDLFYRWVWEIESGYTEDIRTTHANAFMKYLHPQAYSQAYKAAFQKSITSLFDWQRHYQGKPVEWNPIIRFSSLSMPSSRDALTREERTRFREAALSYGSIPNYHSVTPEQRDRWKGYLAQRFGKPKDEVSKTDWERANSWKVPSLIWTAVDAGLRPKEVSQAKVSWVDTRSSVLGAGDGDLLDARCGSTAGGRRADRVVRSRRDARVITGDSPDHCSGGVSRRLQYCARVVLLVQGHRVRRYGTGRSLLFRTASRRSGAGCCLSGGNSGSWICSWSDTHGSRNLSRLRRPIRGDRIALPAYRRMRYSSNQI